MAGMPGQLKTPYGNSPQDLPTPAPGEGMETEVGQMQAQAASGLEPSVGAGEVEQATMTPSAPEVPEAEVEEQAPQSLEELYAEMDQQEQVNAGGDLPMESGEPGVIGSFGEQFREAGMRLRNAFAVTNKESEQVIRESGLFDDVQLRDNTWFVKRKGQKGYSKLDRDGYQLITDTLDFARDAMETGVEAGAEIGGTALGIAGMPITGGTSIMASNPVTAGAVGAVAAKSFGDAVASRIFDIKQDPERSMPLEYTLAAGLGAGLGWMGSSITRRVARRQAAKRSATETMDGIETQVRETMQDVQTLKDSGLVMDEGNLKINPNIATGGNDPELWAAAKWLSTENEYRNTMKKLGNELTISFEGLVKQTGRFAGKNTDNLGREFVLTPKTIQEAEGNVIGQFRQMAVNVSRGSKKTMPKLQEKVSGLYEELGGRVEQIPTRYEYSALGRKKIEGGERLVPPTLKEIKRRHTELNPTQVGVYQQYLTKFGKLLKTPDANTTGHMTMKEMDNLYRELTADINAAMKNPNTRSYGMLLVDMKNALRDDWVENIGQTIQDPKLLKTYTDSIANYRKIKVAQENLGNLLKNESISTSALAQELFGKKRSYQYIESMKTLMDDADPELWQQLGKEYFNHLKHISTDTVSDTLEDGTKRAVDSVNWKKMAGKWRNLDPRVQKELAATTGVGEAGINALFSLGKKFQNADVKLMAKEGNEAFIKRNIRAMANIIFGSQAYKASSALNLLEGIGKDGALVKWLQDGNMEQVIREFKGLPPEKASRLRELADAVYAWKPKSVENQIKMEQLRTAPKTVIRRSAEDEKPE